MVGKAVGSMLGFLGGVLVIMSGVLGFLVSLGHLQTTSELAPLALGVGSALVAVILGLIIVFFARPRWLWWRSRLLVNGVLLLVLGAFAWAALPFGLLLLAGAVLTIIAGLLFIVESFMPGRFGRRLHF